MQVKTALAFCLPLVVYAPGTDEARATAAVVAGSTPGSVPELAVADDNDDGDGAVVHGMYVGSASDTHTHTHTQLFIALMSSVAWQSRGQGRLPSAGAPKFQAKKTKII